MNKFPHLKKYVEILLHISVWLLILGIVNANVDFFWQSLFERQESMDVSDTINGYHGWLTENYDYTPIIRYLILIFFKAFFFYVNAFLIFPRYQRVLPKRKVLQPLLFNLAWCFLAEALIYRAYFNETQADSWYTNDSYEPIESGIAFLMVLAASYAYWAAKQWMLNKDDIEKLGRTSAELALLKNQVNPHFLFNTLNNLFSMAIERQADELAESISQLTNLMRYSIYESRTEYIELHREVDYIENYIKLQKLRFAKDDAVSIRFDAFSKNQGTRISPMLLINFVENAFKHGVSLKQPSMINITLNSTDNQISFTVENTIHRQNKESRIEHAGFGLEHTKKLLAMQYPHRHQLQITEEKNIYRVALVLKLQKTKIEVMA